MNSKLLIIIILLLVSKTNENEQCSFNDMDLVTKDKNFYILTNFKKFSDLKFNCSQLLNISMLAMQPDDKLIFDKSLNFTGLILNPAESIFGMFLRNLKGFNLNSNPFKAIKQKKKLSHYFLTIEQANFDFYDDNNNLITKCDNSTIKIKDNIFSGTSILNFEYNTRFKENTCPLVFSNVYLSIIDLKLSSSFVNKNILGFVQNNQDFKSLNSTIFHAKLMLYHTDLNAIILNKYVFTKLTILDLNGQITKIEEDLFKSFKLLAFIRFHVENINNVLVRNNKWLNSLNYDLKPIDPNNLDQVLDNTKHIIGLIIYQAFYNHTFYDYPEQDLCYFKDFPHNKLIMPRLRPNFKTKCTCTELYLIQYSQKFGEQMKYILTSVPTNYYLINYYPDVFNEKEFTHCYNESFEKTIEKCNFKKRFNLCHVKSLDRKQNNFYFYMNDWNFLTKYSHLIFSLYLNVILSFVSILFQILILIVAKSKNMPKEFNRMYSFLKINSCLNIIYITIRLFKLIDTCSSDDIVCTTIYSKSKFIQYFKIIFIRIIGNSFQTASNLTHIVFTLSRYITITNNKSCLNYIHRISYKKFIFILLVLSLIVNIFTFFTFAIRDLTLSIDQLTPMDLNILFESRQDSFIDYKEKFTTKSEYIILDILKYVKIIFSDIVYIIITFSIDLILLFYVRKKMIKKVQLTVISSFVVELNQVVFRTNSDSTGNSDTTNLADDKKKKINALKHRITLMIILNGVNFLLFRLPLALFSFYGFLFRYDYDEHTNKPSLNAYIICRFFKFCTYSLDDFFYFIYLISFIIQFFIFFKLDKNLKESFRNLKKKFKLKIQNCCKRNS